MLSTMMSRVAALEGIEVVLVARTGHARAHDFSICVLSVTV